MEIDVFGVQIILAILLFFIINWIGKHSYSIGYISISMFVRAEEAPAFNYIVRVLTPVVYLIIVATVLYSLNLDKYVINFYLVNLYYIIFRLTFNLITGRGLLLNWYKQFLYWASIMLFSYIAYKKIIFSKTNVLPDFTTIANELWIIIFIFLFHLANKIELPQEGTIERKRKYLDKTYFKFKRLYGKIIDSKFQNNRLKALAYSILIYENFNRYKLARIVENIKFQLTGKPHTLGVMQVYTHEMINDYKSVELGTDKILETYQLHMEEYNEGKKESYYSDSNLFVDIISNYNTGEEYLLGVDELHTIIEANFYKEDIKPLIERVE